MEQDRLQARAEMQLRVRDDFLLELFRLSYHDATVKAFLDAWQRGYFTSFEQMLIRLSVQLTTDKAELMKTATKAMQLAPPPSFERTTQD